MISRKNARFMSLRSRLLASAAAVLAGVSAAQAGDNIDNGTIQLGINDFGTLVRGGVGLTFIPTDAEALAPGCACEGWGVADFGVGTGFGRSESNGNSGTGTATFAVSGTGTLASSGGSAAISTTTIQEGGTDFARVVHDFKPSSNANLYQVDVTITNIGGLPITNLTYRRGMDWDVPPTTFSEFVTIQGWPAAALRASSDDGFENPNPNAATLETIAADAVKDGNFSNSGPADHGAAFDFGFGEIAPGADQTFTIYYGAAENVDAALAALGAVGAEVYSLGFPNDGSGGPNPTGAPNTFIFAFAGVGGTPVGPVTGPQGELELLRSLGVFVARAAMNDPILRMDGLTSGGESKSNGQVEPGFRFLATGGLSNSDFETQSGLDADIDIARGGIAAEMVFENGGALVGPRAGIGVDFSRADGKLANGSTGDLSATTIYAYAGTSFENGAYVDATLGYSFLNYDLLRAVGAGDFMASPDGHQFSFNANAGIDRVIDTGGKMPGELTAGVFGSVLYTSTSIDGGTETSATLPTGVVSLDGQDVTAYSTRLGGRLSYLMSGGGQTNTRATVWAAWEHQHIGGGDVTGSTAGGTPFTIAVGDVNRDIGVIGVRLAAESANKFTFSGEYEGGFGANFQRHNFMAKLKVKMN